MQLCHWIDINCIKKDEFMLKSFHTVVPSFSVVTVISHFGLNLRLEASCFPPPLTMSEPIGCVIVSQFFPDWGYK